MFREWIIGMSAGVARPPPAGLPWTQLSPNEFFDRRLQANIRNFFTDRDRIKFWRFGSYSYGGFSKFGILQAVEDD